MGGVVERLLVIAVDEIATPSADGAHERAHVRLLDALTLFCPFTEVIRYGVFALPVRAPSRFLGGEAAVVNNCAALVRRTVGATPRLGIAEGLFSAEAAARRDFVIASGETTAFRRSLPIEELLDDKTATTARRLGLHRVGQFADVEPRRVAERFSRSVAERHRVARGEADTWSDRDEVLLRRMMEVKGTEQTTAGQQSFFGQRSEGDRRAVAVGFRAAERVGIEEVLTAAVVGGRTPRERVRWRPLGAPEGTSDSSAPWPGHLPPPSPAATLRHPVRLALRDGDAQPVTVNGRGLLSRPPASVDFGRGGAVSIAWCAGPWPHDEAWWAKRARRAHLHVVLVDQRALWLYAERGSWFLAGVFD